MSIRKLSEERETNQEIYRVLAMDYLLDHPVCEASINGICSYNATQVHHKAGRGSNYTNVDTFLAVCYPCHDWIEKHPKMAKELGFSESRITPIKK